MDNSKEKVVNDIINENAGQPGFENILELAIDFVFLHPIITEDNPGIFLLVSRYACERLGYTKEELLQLGPRVLFTKAEFEQMSEERAALRRDKELVVEAKLVTKNGDLIPVELHSRIIEHQGQSLVLTIGRDLTERKRSEEALRESEQKYKTIYDNSLVALFRITLGDGKPITANNACAELFGYSSKEEFLEEFRTVKHYANPEDREPLIRELTEKGFIDRIEIHSKKTDGTLIWNEAYFLLNREMGYVECVAIDITERKKAEEALRESEANLKEAQEIAHIGSWYLDIENNILLWSDETYRIFGIPKGTPMSYDKFLDHIHPDDKEYVNKEWTAALHGSPYNLEHRIVVNNEIKWVREKARLEADEDGEATGGIGTVQDITRQNLSEKALRESEEKYRTLIDNIPDVIWVTDQKGKTHFISSNVHKIFGFTPEEIYTAGSEVWFGRIHPDDASSVKENYQALIEEDKEFDVEYRIQRKDGEWIWLHDKALRSIEKEGDRHVFGVFREITDRKLIEKKLLMTQYSVDHNRMPTVWVKPDARIFYVNDATCGMLGYSREELLNMTVPDVDSLWPMDKWLSPEGYSFLKTQGFSLFESVWKRKDGTEVPVEIVANAVKFEGQEFLFAFILDITDRKKAEEALKVSEEKYRSIFRNTLVGLFRSGIEDGLCLEANDEMARMFRFPNREAMIGKFKFIESWVDSNLRQVIKDQLIETGVANNFEAQFLMNDGEIIWIRFSSRIWIEKGYFEGCAIDITEQKYAEEELKKYREQLEKENITLREKIKLAFKHDAVFGESPAIKKVLEQVEQVAATNSTVLILGETGTGKELIARAIHRLSDRKDRSMITVNCASLPPGLIEGELFGREKGAYTGALTRQVGRFELADGSTIFLDEIGELPLDLQAKLLRVLQEGEFERLGSPDTIKVDIRVIAATNRDLKHLLEEGKFREDLYYRLNVFPIVAPPLRDRKDDIPLLVFTFIDELNKSMGKRIDTISKARLNALKNFHWPGNVRELRNVIERAMIQSPSTELLVELPGTMVTLGNVNMTIDEVQKAHIIKVLECTGWKVRGENGAAKILGLKPTTLDSKLSKLGIHKP